MSVNVQKPLQSMIFGCTCHCHDRKVSSIQDSSKQTVESSNIEMMQNSQGGELSLSISQFQNLVHEVISSTQGFSQEQKLFLNNKIVSIGNDLSQKHKSALIAHSVDDLNTQVLSDKNPKVKVTNCESHELLPTHEFQLINQEMAAKIQSLEEELQAKESQLREKQFEYQQLEERYEKCLKYNKRCEMQFIELVRETQLIRESIKNMKVSRESSISQLECSQSQDSLSQGLEQQGSQNNISSYNQELSIERLETINEEESEFGESECVDIKAVHRDFDEGERLDLIEDGEGEENIKIQKSLRSKSGFKNSLSMDHLGRGCHDDRGSLLVSKNASKESILKEKQKIDRIFNGQSCGKNINSSDRFLRLIRNTNVLLKNSSMPNFTTISNSCEVENVKVYEDENQKFIDKGQTVYIEVKENTQSMTQNQSCQVQEVKPSAENLRQISPIQKDIPTAGNEYLEALHFLKSYMNDDQIVSKTEPDEGLNDSTVLMPIESHILNCSDGFARKRESMTKRIKKNIMKMEEEDGHCPNTCKNSGSQNQFSVEPSGRKSVSKNRAAPVCKPRKIKVVSNKKRTELTQEGLLIRAETPLQTESLSATVILKCDFYTLVQNVINCMGKRKKVHLSQCSKTMKIEYESGYTYEGSFIEVVNSSGNDAIPSQYKYSTIRHLQNGVGNLKDENSKTVYSGEWKNGLFDGKGKFISNVKKESLQHGLLQLLQFNGVFCKGKIVGDGQTLFRDGSKMIMGVYSNCSQVHKRTDTVGGDCTYFSRDQNIRSGKWWMRGESEQNLLSKEKAGVVIFEIRDD